jgi:sigma-B regulation protein RsbU (phosphoserine phosphatase)
MTVKSKEQIERGQQLYQLTSLVAGEFSLPEVLDKLAEAAVKIIGVKACSIRLLDEETNDLKMRSTYGLSEAYRNKGVVSKNDPVVKAAFAGEAIVLDDMRVDGRIKYREATLKEGLVSQMTVAMTFRNQAIGVLRLYSPRPKHFDDDDINLARSVASQCAVAITNARFYTESIKGAKIAEQMRLAGIIQRRMIPETLPQIQGLDIDALYYPCFDVGGDFYDFLPLGPNKLGIVIADVIGKGLPAAIMMSWLRGAIRAYTDTFHQAIQVGDSAWDEPNQIALNEAYVKRAVAKFNRLACQECRDGEFITLFYAILDSETRTMSYSSCGHEPTVLIRGDQDIDLDRGGLVLGLDPNTAYEAVTVTLEENDCLIFYTDGLTDALNFDGQLWSKSQMLEAARRALMCNANHITKAILQYRRRFVGLARQLDDTSVVVVKIAEKKPCDDCQALSEE